MLSDVNIYFGKVVELKDDLKINRVKIPINGYTDKLTTDELPWYFPWYGQSFLPLLNDVVPIIIFDKNFNTGFYGQKINLTDISLSEDDYETYLEIYKRQIDNKNIVLTYKKSEGILFQNDKSKINIGLDFVDFICGNNKIHITEDKIELGSSNLEPTLLGDKTVNHLKDIISHQNNIISKIFQILTAINTAASGTPFTMPISGAMASLLTSSLPLLMQENAQLTAKTNSNTLQSKKVSNE